MREKLFNYGNDFINANNVETPVEQLWCSFRDHLLTTIDEFVPSKIARNNRKQPWITRSIKQLSRRKQKSYIITWLKQLNQLYYGKSINL